MQIFCSSSAAISKAGRAYLKKGVVRDEDAQREACERIEVKLAELGWTLIGRIESPIAGGDGNREFLVGAQRRSPHG